MTAILIAGYPYIKENYFRTFNYYLERDKVFFLLPKIWKAKGGKLKFHPPKKENVYATNAFFYHSNYQVIGGLLKGWMPLFPLFIAKRKFEIVFSPSEPILLATLYQGFWAKLFGLKHVIFTWENIPYESKFRGLNGFFKKIILKFNLFFCDGVICGNNKAKNIFAKLTPKPVAVIPLSGVDTDFFRREDGPKKIGALDLMGKVVFNFSGAIGYRKGIHIIFEAFKKVLAEIPNAHLLIVGSGEYEESLKLKVESLKLKDVATFIPWVNRDELRQLFSVSDVFLYPSLPHEGWEEQFGYSMAEASLMELPVISTKSGSIDEVILDGKTGLLVEPDNFESLGEAMIKLGKNPELRKTMGQAGRKYIEENYSYQVVANKFYGFFNEITLHR